MARRREGSGEEGVKRLGRRRRRRARRRADDGREYYVYDGVRAADAALGRDGARALG